MFNLSLMFNLSQGVILALSALQDGHEETPGKHNGMPVKAIMIDKNQHLSVMLT